MGNDGFRLSDIMPCCWLYKLKDVARFSRRQNIQSSMKRSHLPTTKMTPKPQSYLPRRASYCCSKERIEGFPHSPINHKASDTRFPVGSPSKSRSNTQRKATEPSSKLVSAMYPVANSENIDISSKGFLNQFEKFEDLELLSELKLPPILTKPPKKEIHKVALHDTSCLQHSKGIRRRSKIRAHQIEKQPRCSGVGTKSFKAYKHQQSTLLQSLVVVKSSLDPHSDFRESMVEMIVENNIGSPKDLEDLLVCYLFLNPRMHHDIIIKVFEQIWFDLAHSRL